MGQACSMCDSESQGEFNVDVKDLPGCCDEHVTTEVGARRKKEKKGKKDKKEKKDKGVKKDKLQPQDTKTPGQTPAHAAKVPPLELGGLGAAPPAQGGAPAVAPQQPEAPDLVSLEDSQHVSRPWSMLPSVGTWLHPHPSSTQSFSRAALEAQAAVPGLAGSAEALDAGAIDEQAALAEVFASAAADEALATAAAETPLCPSTRKAVFVDGLAVPAAKWTDKLELVDMRSWEEVALAEIFAEAAEATKPSELQAVMQDAPVAALLQAARVEPLKGGGGQGDPAAAAAPQAAWVFKPSVGTWLRTRQPPVAEAPTAPGPVAEKPLAALAVDVVPLDVPIPLSPPSVLSVLAASGACGSPVPGGDAVVSYGPQLPPHNSQDVPVATPLADKGPPATTTTTTAAAGEPAAGGPPPAVRAGRKTLSL